MPQETDDNLLEALNEPMRKARGQKQKEGALKDEFEDLI